MSILVDLGFVCVVMSSHSSKLTLTILLQLIYDINWVLTIQVTYWISLGKLVLISKSVYNYLLHPQKGMISIQNTSFKRNDISFKTRILNL